MMNAGVVLSSVFSVADLVFRELDGIVVKLVSPGGVLLRLFGLLLETTSWAIGM